VTPGRTSLTFRRNSEPPSSEMKRKQKKKTARSRMLNMWPSVKYYIPDNEMSKSNEIGSFSF
jgi:hypothetical protein